MKSYTTADTTSHDHLKTAINDTLAKNETEISSKLSNFILISENKLGRLYPINYWFKKNI